MQAITKFYDLSAIDRADLAASTREKYKRALRAYLNGGHTLMDAPALSAYAAGLPKSGRSFLKAAVRLVTKDIEMQAKASATPENIEYVQTAVYRLEAVNDAIKVKAAKGEGVHIWLSQTQVKRLMEAAADDLRDYVVLALMVGAGLRASEVVGLRFDALKYIPKRKNGGGMRPVLDIEGKGAKKRVVPISDKLAERLQAWREVVGAGLIARSLPSKGQEGLGDSLSTVGAFKLVRKYGALIGVPELSPHDLRRTWAQLGYDAGVPITQISKLLGHSSVAVTQRYLNLDLDLDTSIADFIPL